MVGALGKRIRRHRGLLVASLIVSIGTNARGQGASVSSREIDDDLRKAVEERRLPGVVAMVAEGDSVYYQGAFGKQYAAKGVPMATDSIFRIASMTKAVTSVAVMQLVERGRVKLDEPAATYLPELARVEVLEGFDAKGTARLRPPKTPVTVRQLLTHTSGFGYEFFDEKLSRYVAEGGVPSVRTGDGGFLKAPLVFDPGTKWEYGISTDWLGKLVETVTGQSLEEYFRQNIFAPLGMGNSFFKVPANKQMRVVTLHQRKDDGSLYENPPEDFKPVQFLSGGGGLYSTADDYLKFTRMLLCGGKLGNTRVLEAETVALMGRNQIGDLTLTDIKSLAPQLARNVRMPGLLDKFGLGFAINTQPVEAGRASGSMAWAGVYNTFFWIDPTRKTTAVLMMQLLPFMDEAAKALLEEFELDVYGSRARKNRSGRAVRTGNVAARLSWPATTP
jgi:CubicO group peptidase (beta-lactamase class C family)